MKTLGLKMVSLFFLMAGGIAVIGQDRQEVPGDYFSLEGALELFKKSKSPEEFERLLNSPDSRVNNLDLNGDGETDYIRVIDRNEGNVHAFILQAIISSSESQDVAVIELEKLANGKAVLQITGDEDVYGVETIIEPTEEVRVYAGTTTTRTVVNVWAWPSVQYVYSPYYSVWVSPWHWHFRPVWWFSWSPIGYYDYYSYWQPYRPYYSHCYTHRIAYAREIYRPYRTSSHTYYSRHSTRIAHYRSTNRQDDHNNRDRYVDHNRRNHYTDERTGRDRYDAGKNGRDDNNTTPVVRQRSNSDERGNGYVRNKERQTNTNMDRTAPGKRYDHQYTRRSDDGNRPKISERNTNVQPRNTNRSSDRSISMNRGSQNRESRSYERSDNRGRSSGGGNGGGNRSGSHGKGKR